MNRPVAAAASLAEHEAFRDELASIAPDGRRRWIYARQPSGRFYRARTLVSIVLLAVLAAGPFVQVGGQPAVLLNVLERRFIVLGVAFWPQDFALVVLVALTLLIGLAVSTIAIGRVWCGWLCPQTVFLEMVFRRLEYLIEGSAAQQIRRVKGPWIVDRIWRALLKHAIFFALSFAIANLFLAYIIGARDLWRIVTDPPDAHLYGLIAITMFSLVFYAVFARFREQACVLACPYGRVMSALVGPRTITVTYDAPRGEPRGRQAQRAAAGAAAHGDCVDCFQCVTVCPTGIDIRNGIQLECVNCTACIDACDDVMERTGRPRGLIRLTSPDALGGAASPRRARARRLALSAAAWVSLAAVVGFLIARRPAVDALVLRQAGSLYATTASGEVVNVYTLQVFNRTPRPQRFEIVATSPRGARVTLLTPDAQVGPHALLDARLLVSAPPASLAAVSTPVHFELRVAGAAPQPFESAMLGPAPGARGGGQP